MHKSLFLISLALSSAACSQSGSDAAAPVEAMNARADTQPTPEPPEVPAAKATNFEDNSEDDDGSRTFAYSWPAAVNRIPELQARFVADRDEQLAEQKDDWQEAIQDSPVDCGACRNRAFEKEWKVVADLENWLSLSASFYDFSGGAHGNHGKSSLIWDRKAKRAVEGVEMFNSPVALETALGAKLCNALDRERSKRRGEPVTRDGEWSTDCPGIDEATVLVGSSNGKTFDRIGIYYGPYVAGAYAEGDYELDFPVTASILDAVKPQFASAFSVTS
ncbi:PdaC/SigV domain-containing protein [Qipengyuania sp. 483]